MEPVFLFLAVLEGGYFMSFTKNSIQLDEKEWILFVFWLITCLSQFFPFTSSIRIVVQSKIDILLTLNLVISLTWYALIWCNFVLFAFKLETRSEQVESTVFMQQSQYGPVSCIFFTWFSRLVSKRWKDLVSQGKSLQNERNQATNIGKQ